jgi:hypothetical protein
MTAHTGGLPTYKGYLSLQLICGMPPPPRQSARAAAPGVSAQPRSS